MAVIYVGINGIVNNKKFLNTDHMLGNIKNIAWKCKRYGIQKILIWGLLTTNCLVQDLIEVDKLIKNMCNIEGIAMLITTTLLALIYLKMAYTCWILANSALDSSAEKTVNMDSNEDKSPDLEKLQDARWKYLKQPLLTYLNINSLRNKVIDLKEIVGYLLPDYLVLSEAKLDDSFPLAQFNLPKMKFELDVIGVNMEEA